MRIRNTDVSYTISEMPPRDDSQSMIEHDHEDYHLGSKIIAEHEHHKEEEEENDQGGYEMKAIKRPKSSMGLSGR